MNKISKVTIVIIIFTASFAYSQSNEGVSIGNSLKPAEASAILELFSATKGFLPPRMTTVERNNIVDPASGLVVYDTDRNMLLFYHDGWKEIGLWKISGNTIYYDSGNVFIQSDTTFPLQIMGKQGIFSMVSGDTVPVIPNIGSVSNGFRSEFTNNEAFYGNVVVSTQLEGIQESVGTGIASYIQNNSKFTFGISADANYIGTGAAELSDFSSIPLTIGIQGNSSVDDTDAIAISVGGLFIADSDHNGFNVGTRFEARSDETYANIGTMTAVNGDNSLIDSLLSRFPERITIASLSINEYSDSADFNIYAVGNAKNIFEGNVGIGTALPQAKLHLQGSYLFPAIQITGPDGFQQIEIDTDVRILDTLVYTVGPSAGYVLTSDEYGMALWKPNVEVTDYSPFDTSGNYVFLKIDTNNVGIGTSSPEVSLHIERDESPGVYVKETVPTHGAFIALESERLYHLLSNESGYFRIEDLTANEARLSIDESGNIGIGTSSPEVKLDVAGDFHAENATASVVTVNDTLKIPTGSQQGFLLTSNSDGAASWQAPLTYYKSISLSSAQILSLYSTPIELVPAPGSGKKIVPYQILYKYNYGTTTYVQSGIKGFSIGFPTNSGATVFQVAQAFTVASSYHSNLALYTPSPPDGEIQYYENEPLKIYGLQANPTTGNGTAQVEVFYTIVPF